MSHPLDRGRPTNRYRVFGRLVTDTALHIGGGHETSIITDSPVVRDVAGEPIIPGSSLKGAFRSTVERLVPVLDLRTCQLSDGYGLCLSTNSKWAEAYRTIAGQVGGRLGTDAEKAVQALECGASALSADVAVVPSVGSDVTEDKILELLDVFLCETCKTFGSVHLASSVLFHDLHVDGEWNDVYQIRDGVGIDRDSERARDQIKFDYEVVPPETTFSLGMTIDGPRKRDLGMIAIGLSELVRGMVPLGGIRSRGLGKCHLDALRIECVDLANDEQRRDYLLHGTMRQITDVQAFLEKHVAALLDTGTTPSPSEE